MTRIHERGTGSVQSLLSVAGALLTAACVSSPQSNSSVSGTVISFEGVYPYEPGTTISIQAREPDGSYTVVGSTSVSRDHRWAVSLRLPERFWPPGPCGAASIQAFSNESRAPIPGVDSACLAELGPTPTLEQRISCNTSTITVQRAEIHRGDLTLNGTADAERYGCVTEVRGNLTIQAGGEIGDRPYNCYLPDQRFSLPNLVEVTGDLTLDGGHVERVEFERLERIGGSLDLTLHGFYTCTPRPGAAPGDFGDSTTAGSFPSLTTVSASVAVHPIKDSGVSWPGAKYWELGLFSLENVGVDVLIDNATFPAGITGLNALTTIPGDLVVYWPRSDLDAAHLLEGLTSVGGDLQLTLPPNARNLAGALTTVGGDVSISSVVSSLRVSPNLLPALERVNGDLSLPEETENTGCWWLPSLERVTGTLRTAARHLGGSIGSSSGLVVGALDYRNSEVPNLSLGRGFRVSGAGPIAIQDNSAVCQCQVDAFIATLAASGWTGSARSSGNGTANPACAATCAFEPGCP